MPDQALKQKTVVFSPSDITPLSLSDLIQPEVTNQIRGMIMEFINTDSLDECQQTYSLLRSKITEFESAFPENAGKIYTDLLKLLEINQARYLPVSKQLKYYSDSILLLLKYNLNPKEIFEIAFLFSDNISRNDKAQAKSTFEKSSELLGSQLLEIEGQERKLPQTIQNWLLDYRQILAKKNLELSEGYGRAYYFSNSKNYQSLTEADKELLKQILDFYGWLQTPSSSLFPLSPKSQTGAPGIRTDRSEILQPREVRITERPMPSRKFTPLPSASEIKREISTKELPGSTSPVYGSKPPAPPPRISSMPSGPKLPVSGELKSLDDIQVIDDLKQIEVAHLRQGLIGEQIETIKSKIVYLASVNRVIPYQAVNAFEQSPLFKEYLHVGAYVIADEKADRKQAFDEAINKLKAEGQQGLNFVEFEAMADLRKEIEKM